MTLVAVNAGVNHTLARSSRLERLLEGSPPATVIADGQVQTRAEQSQICGMTSGTPPLPRRGPAGAKHVSPLSGCAARMWDLGYDECLAWGRPPPGGTNRSIEQPLAFVTEDLPGLRTA